MKHAEFFRRKQCEEIIKATESNHQDQELLKRQRENLAVIAASIRDQDDDDDDDDDDDAYEGVDYFQDQVEDYEQVTFIPDFNNSDTKSNISNADSGFYHCDVPLDGYSNKSLRELCDQGQAQGVVREVHNYALRKAFGINMTSLYDTFFFKQYSKKVIKTASAKDDPTLKAVAYVKTMNYKENQHTWNLSVDTILARACHLSALKDNHISPSMVKILDTCEIDYPIWPAVDNDIPFYCKEHVMSSTTYKSDHDRYLYHTCDLEIYDIIIMNSPISLPCGPAAWSQMARRMKSSAFIIINVNNADIEILRPKEIITFFKKWYEGDPGLELLDPTSTSVLYQLIDSAILRLCRRYSCKKPEWDDDDDDDDDNSFLDKKHL